MNQESGMLRKLPRQNWSTHGCIWPKQYLSILRLVSPSVFMQAVLQGSGSPICRPTSRQVWSPESAVLLVLRRDRCSQHLCSTFVLLTFVWAGVSQQLAQAFTLEDASRNKGVIFGAKRRQWCTPFWLLSGCETYCVLESDSHLSPCGKKSQHSKHLQRMYCKRHGTSRARQWSTFMHRRLMHVGALPLNAS